MTLKINHISKSYGDKKVLQNVSCSLEQGKIYVLMGTNGSGKTTLFNIISGFLKANNGVIELDSDTLKTAPPHQINQKRITRTF